MPAGVGRAGVGALGGDGGIAQRRQALAGVPDGFEAGEFSRGGGGELRGVARIGIVYIRHHRRIAHHHGLALGVGRGRGVVKLHAHDLVGAEVVDLPIAVAVLANEPEVVNEQRLQGADPVCGEAVLVFLGRVVEGLKERAVAFLLVGHDRGGGTGGDAVEDGVEDAAQRGLEFAGVGDQKEAVGQAVAVAVPFAGKVGRAAIVGVVKAAPLRGVEQGRLQQVGRAGAGGEGMGLFVDLVGRGVGVDG